MALTIKTETSNKPKEFVLLGKWDAVFESVQSFYMACGLIPRCDKQPRQNFEVKQHASVHSMSRRGGCILLTGQSQAES